MMKLLSLAAAAAVGAACWTHLVLREATASPHENSSQVQCARVAVKALLPEPYRKRADRESALGDEGIYAWIQDVLTERLFSYAERWASESLSQVSVVISRNYSTFFADVDPMGCAQAENFLRSKLLLWQKVEVGIVGADPIFTNPDFQSKMKSGRDSVALVLQESAAKRYEEVTARNLGRDLYVSIDGKRVILPIRTVVDSGLILLDRTAVPVEVTEAPLLPFPLEVVGCEVCTVP